MFQTLIPRCILIAAFLTAGAAFAQDGDARICSAKTLNRSYAFRVDGWLGSGPAVIPFSAVGVQNFDGNGKFTANNTVSSGGTVMRNFPFSGTYTVNRDCTGSMVADFGNGMTSRADFAIASNGDEIFFISAEAQTTYTGSFRRQ